MAGKNVAKAMNKNSMMAGTYVRCNECGEWIVPDVVFVNSLEVTGNVGNVGRMRDE